MVTVKCWGLPGAWWWEACIGKTRIATSVRSYHSKSSAMRAYNRFAAAIKSA